LPLEGTQQEQTNNAKKDQPDGKIFIPSVFLAGA
jgi:hypothetical protein